MTRIVRIQHGGATHVGLLRDGGVALPGDGFNSVARILERLDAARDAAARGRRLPLADVRLLAPIDPDARVFAVAQNYRQHAQEVSGTDSPPKPVLFMKPSTALVGPAEPIELPPVTSFLDYEAELAVVVGRGGARLTPEQAAGLVAAATCLNDGSARDLQPAELGGKPVIDWFSGKSLDRTGAVGPWLVTCHDSGELADRFVRCEVNRELVQDDRTSSMVFSIAELLSFISHRLALRPGDVLATGTPGGVGSARGRSLRPGDTVVIDVEGVGRLENVIARA